MRALTITVALLVLAACTRPEPEPEPASTYVGSGEITCLAARQWADEVKACRADPACMSNPTKAYDVAIKEGDIEAANEHFGCGIQ